MTQDCAFDVRHLGLGRPASSPRDRAFAMPIAGLGLTQPSGVGEINMPQQKIESTPWHSYVGPAAGSSGKSAELMPGGEELFPHGGHYTNKPGYHGINGLPEGVGREPTGVGISVTPPTPLFSSANVISCPAGFDWVAAFPPAASSPSVPQLTPALFNWISGWAALYPARAAADGNFYFHLGTPSGTPLQFSPGFNSVSVCAKVATVVHPSGGVVVPASGGAATVGVAFSAAGVPTVKYSANPLGAAFFALPLPPNAPPPGVPTFVTAPGMGQFSWVLVTPVPGQRPTAPPPGAALPGVWALVRPHFWMWYPSPPRTLAVVNTYFVYTNSDQLLGIPNPGLPRPTAPPPQVAGTAAANGQWINSGPGYWAWAPTMSMSATPTTSYAWLWALLLVGGVGAGAYYLLD
jgi:hypothetical protein